MSDVLYDQNGNPINGFQQNSDGVPANTDALATAGFKYGYNGVSWDRLVTMPTNMDGMAVASKGIQQVHASVMAFNGTTYDRTRSGGTNTDSLATLSTGVQHTNAFPYLWNGVTWDRQQSGAAMMNGMNGKGMLATVMMLYNGSTFDFRYSNIQGTLMTSAARTSTVNSATITNYNGSTLILTVNVTAVSGTTPTLAVTIYGTDGLVNFPIMATSSNITATGSYTFVVSPTAVTGATVTQSANMYVPRQFYVAYTIGGTSPSFTFASNYSLAGI